MWFWDDIKRRFLTTKIVILLLFVAISLIFSPKIVYASDIEEYRPSYTWADELYKLQESSRSYADTIRRFEDNARHLETSIKDSIDLQLNKPIKLAQSYVDNIHRFETKIMRDSESLSKSLISTPSIDFERNTRPIREFDGLIDRPFVGAPSLPIIQEDYSLTKRSIPMTEYKPSYTWVDRTKAFGKGYWNYAKGQLQSVVPGGALQVSGGALSAVIGITGSIEAGHRSGSAIERGLRGEIAPEDMIRQHVLEVWRTFLPEVGELAYQEYIHNPSTFKDDSFYQQRQSSETFRVRHTPMGKDFEPPFKNLQSNRFHELSRSYADILRSLETKTMRDMGNITRDTMLTNSIKYDQYICSLETKFARDMDMESISRNSILTNPQAYDKYMHSLETKMIQGMEDVAKHSMLTNPVMYDKYVQPQTIQDHYNFIGRSFNNLPSTVTLRHDYDLSNRISRFEDIQMPKFESIRMEPMSMPSFDSMSIPTTSLP